MKIKPGYGYWCIDRFPIGGDFHRASKTEGLEIKNLEKLKKSIDGCNAIAETLTGSRIAFSLEHIEQ